jgi:hypothetical protein
MKYLTRGSSLTARSVAVAVAGALAAIGSAAPASAARASHEQPVHGDWQTLVACVMTRYDPATGRGSCDGSTLWRGTWTGVTHYTVRGFFDLVTGDASGTIGETFVGMSDDGGSGTLRFNERFTLDGATSALHIDAWLLGGTGSFAGSRGFVTFDGQENAVFGSGTYAGTWTRPASRARRVRG